MAKYDYGGGCPCGLNRECDCGAEIRIVKEDVPVKKEKVRVLNEEDEIVEEIDPPAHDDPTLDVGDLFTIPEEHLRKAEKIKAERGGGEYTGGSVNYYKIFIDNPTTADAPYMAECNDIIESLNMNFAEGNAFKAIWRMAAARLGKTKKGYDNGLYDAEKVVFFGKRMVEIQKRNKNGN